MSLRWPNSIVNKTLTTPSGTQSTPGLWKLNTVAEYVQQALWPKPPTYIEDVFSTYLYTGNGSTQTINNGIDLAGKGGMVWQKIRSSTGSNLLTDTVRGSGYALVSNNANAQFYNSSIVSSFNADGFTDGGSQINGATYASWTFRKAPKFFDVVTYTGNGVAGRTISHSLGSVPGMIIVKCTSNSGNWPVYHRSTGNAAYTILNATFPADTDLNFWYNTSPTSSTFTVNDYDSINGSGKTYVAYLFAHDTTTDGLIQCGSFTTDASGNATVNLGFEPQYVLTKRSSGLGNWNIIDNMRGWNVSGDDFKLSPNTNGAEGSSEYGAPNATGFTYTESASSTYIYMAIRRGPMKTPTDGTKVYGTDTEGGTLPNPPGYNANFPVDFAFYKNKTSGTGSWVVSDRLRGAVYSVFQTTAAEAANSASTFDYQNGWNSSAGTSSSYQSWMFRRAPGFFDVVCYTGTGGAQSINHNLGVAPELMIVKCRSAAQEWYVYAKPITANYSLYLNENAGKVLAGGLPNWNNTEPTSSVFTVGYAMGAGATYVAYLFASCPGVSKVGSYTGTGAQQDINCGFTNGARFVMIKRTDSTGDWFVWDTARGMVAGTDPRLALNSTAAETNANWVYTTTGGFQIVSTDASVNASGGSYIFLAIA